MSQQMVKDCVRKSGRIMDSGFSGDAECREKVMCLVSVVIFQKVEEKEEKTQNISLELS